MSPHPDDETLGAGGSIFKWLNEGKKVYWLNVTEITEEIKIPEEVVNRRQEQLKKVEELYNFTGIYKLDLPTTKLEVVDSAKAIELFRNVINEIEPDTLILPDYNDAHSDHKKVFEWGYACSKSFRFPFIKNVMTMEILSETDYGHPQNPFIPNYYVDITKYIEKKVEALNIYDTEVDVRPFPRNSASVYALASLRGNVAGVLYAEAFKILKTIEK